MNDTLREALEAQFPSVIPQGLVEPYGPDLWIGCDNTVLGGEILNSEELLALLVEVFTESRRAPSAPPADAMDSVVKMLRANVKVRRDAARDYDRMGGPDEYERAMNEERAIEAEKAADGMQRVADYLEAVREASAK